MHFLLRCLIVVPPPPGKTPFAAQLNINNKKNKWKSIVVMAQ
jgi:hypothetical protein